MFEKLAKKLSQSTNRRRNSSIHEGIYEGSWIDSDGVNILRSELIRRYPDTSENMLQCMDRSSNFFQWIASQVGGIYERAPVRKVNDVELDSYYNSKMLNLCLAEAVPLTWALGQTLVRPVPTEEHVMLQILTPQYCEVIPEDLDPFTPKQLVYMVKDEEDKTEYVVWTKNIHAVFEDMSLSQPSYLIENPYGCVPFVMAHSHFPGKWGKSSIWNPYKSESIARGNLEAAVSMTHLRHIMKWTAHQLMVLFGKVGKDFNANLLLDPSNPLTMGEKARVETFNMQVKMFEYLETTLKMIETPANLEGIRPEMIRGGLSATSGADRRLQMTDLEKNRDNQRTLWSVVEEKLMRVASMVIHVEKRRTCLSHIPEIPKTGLDVDFADLGAAMGKQESQNYWSGRLADCTATREQAIAALDDVDMDEARHRALEALLEKSKMERSALVPMTKPAL